MSKASDTLFEFPCDFPLKVMGRHTDDFRSIVLQYVQEHPHAVTVPLTIR